MELKVQNQPPPGTGNTCSNRTFMELKEYLNKGWKPDFRF